MPGADEGQVSEIVAKAEAEFVEPVDEEPEAEEPLPKWMPRTVPEDEKRRRPSPRRLSRPSG